MRKALIAALAGAALGVGGLMAVPAAKATSSCPTGPTVNYTGGASGSLAVGTPAGCLTLTGDGASASGSAVADGASSNPGPASGYIGIDDSDGQGTVVGCASGDYTPGGGTQYDPPPAAGEPDTRNHVIGSPAHPPAAPDPADPCTPTAP